MAIRAPDEAKKILLLHTLLPRDGSQPSRATLKPPPQVSRRNHKYWRRNDLSLFVGEKMTQPRTIFRFVFRWTGQAVGTLEVEACSDL